MIQLLYMVIFMEMGVIIVLSFKTPLRKLVLMLLDSIKRGRGPVVVKTVAGTISVVMLSYAYTMMMTKKRWIDDGTATQTDQIILAQQLLQTTLMGGVLFLALVIDKLHHYIKELRIRRQTMENAKKQGHGFEDAGGSDKVTALEEEVAIPRAMIKQQRSD